MKILVKGVVWLMLVFPAIITAQESGEYLPDLSNEKREKIKAFKVGYLTEKLSLTSEEAAKFWPVYNSFQEKKHALRQEVFGDRKKKKKNIDALSDEELEKLVNSRMELKERMLMLEKEFHVKIKEILPIRKVFLLGKAEKSFKREIIKRMRKRKKGKKGH